jgi:hypothetical protein
MAKELPFFKFEPNQWENGNIQLLSREDKGLFIDLCSIYWSRLGDVPLKLAIQKLCAGNATALNSLCDEKIIEVIEGNIFIKFLSEQLNEFEDTSKQNSKNAKEGWEKRRKQKDESERNATALNPQCENDAIREDKRKEDKRKEEKLPFDLFWNLYPKKIAKNKCEPKWNKLDLEVQKLILETLPNFIKYKPFETYTHPNPETYFNQQRWNDEIQTNALTDKKHYYLCSPFGRWDGLLTEDEFKAKTFSGHWTLEKIV